MKSRKIIIAIAILAGLLLLWWSFSRDEEEEKLITVKAFVDEFEISVSSSGELMAKNSEDIIGPTNMRRYRLYNIKIAELVPEGTYVDSGDFVASLDKTELSTKMSDLSNELEKARSQYTQTRLDTALTLREKRSSLESLRFDIKQKKVEIAQSKFEPPATQQRLKLDLEKLEQSLQQAEENYEITRQQSVAKMKEAAATLAQSENEFKQLLALEKEFRITAPKPGMVIYKRTWGGGKRTTGSTISPWDPGVATLPDLSVMQSKTYINEVDIRKVKVGHPVEIGLDAFPEAQLSGTVTEVANVGEKREGNSSNVFEVVIEVAESDSTYRPGMTTSNRIITHRSKEELQIPLEAVFSRGDTTFVYRRSGMAIERQMVQLGQSNDEFATVNKGLQEGDEVYLSEPPTMAGEPIQSIAAADEV